MSTTSPVISLDAEASRLSLPCSAARASGENASAEMNPTATATFKLFGIVELNMHRTCARNSRWSILATGQWRGELREPGVAELRPTEEIEPADYFGNDRSC